MLTVPVPCLVLQPSAFDAPRELSGEPNPKRQGRFDVQLRGVGGRHQDVHLVGAKLCMQAAKTCSSSDQASVGLPHHQNEPCEHATNRQALQSTCREPEYATQLQEQPVNKNNHASFSGNVGQMCRQTSLRLPHAAVQGAPYTADYQGVAQPQGKLSRCRPTTRQTVKGYPFWICVCASLL